MKRTIARYLIAFVSWTALWLLILVEAGVPYQ